MMWASFVSLSVVPWILFAQSSWNMDAVPVITAAPPPSESSVAVRDRGEVFSRGAERRAQEALGRVYRRHGTPVLIETRKSLDGAWIADVARRQGRMAGAQQLYILAAGDERDVGVIAARRGPASRLTDQQRETIRRAFLGPLQAGEADEALAQGVRAIGTTLDAAASRPASVGRDALIAVAILLASLAVLLASRIWEWSGVRSGRRHGASDGASVPRVPRARPGADMVQSLSTARASVPCREKVEA